MMKKKFHVLSILMLCALLVLALRPPFGIANATDGEDGAEPAAQTDTLPVPDAEAPAEPAEPAPPITPVYFSDLSGHWAQAAMQRAYEEGLIRGYPGDLMEPDRFMDKAEVLTILTRLIGAVPPGELDGADITAEDWFHDAAAQAVGLKLLDARHLTDMDTAISREDAFALIATAFQLTHPAQKTDILSRYTDAAALSIDANASVAALLSAGYIQGHDGTLEPKKPITRAEFITILGRMLSPAASPEALGEAASGAILLPSKPVPEADPEAEPEADPETPDTVTWPAEAAVHLSDLELHNDLFLTAAAESLTLENLRSDARILLRSAELKSLNMIGGSVSQLIIAAASGDLTFAPQKDGNVTTLTVGDGGGSIRLGDGIRQVEITGSNRTVYLDMRQLERLTVSGSDSVIIAARDCQIAEITLLAAGEDNALTIDGSADKLTVLGDRSVVDGKGQAGEALVRGLDCRIDLKAENLVSDPDYGLGALTLTLTPSHTPLPVGETLVVTAQLQDVRGSAVVSARWYQDGVSSAMYQNPAFPVIAGITSDFFPIVSYTDDMALTTTVGLELLYQRGDVLQRIWQEIEIPLENHPYEYYHPGPKATDKLIAITFDDGPCANTSRLLDILADRDVKATFFLVGASIQYRPEIISRMLEEGHEVGSHTYNHPDLSRQSAATIRSELQATNAAIKEASGHTPTLVRPPYGAYNQTVRDVCKENGLAIINWSVDTEDWKSRNAETILRRIFYNGRGSAKDGDIILMHDTVGASVDVIGIVIDRMLAEGYHFVTVSELIELRCDSEPQPGSVYFYGR